MEEFFRCGSDGIPRGDVCELFPWDMGRELLEVVFAAPGNATERRRRVKSGPKLVYVVVVPVR